MHRTSFIDGVKLAITLGLIFLSLAAAARNFKFNLDTSHEALIVQKLKNLGLKQDSCPNGEKVDAEEVRKKALADFIDLELERRLKKSESKLSPETKAVMRVSLYEMCSQQKYGNQKEIAKQVEAYKSAVLGDNFDVSQILVPNLDKKGADTSVNVIVERGLKGHQTGWVKATYTTSKGKLGLLQDHEKDIEVSVRKNIFDIIDLSCYREIDLDSRTSIYDGIVSSTGNKEVFSIAERRFIESKGLPFMVGDCKQARGDK